jgi:nickel/cobalt exporter
MKRIIYLILILLSLSELQACALCRADRPILTVDTNITALSNKTHFRVKWNFHPLFLSQMLLTYDDNKNGKLDPPEQKLIRKALEDYIRQYNYLTRISYAPFDARQSKSITIKPVKTEFYIDKNRMYYLFDFDADFILNHGHTLELISFDKLGNFGFINRDTVLKNYKEKYKMKVLSNEILITFGDPDKPAAEDASMDSVHDSLPSSTQSVGLLGILSQKLTTYKLKLKNLLVGIKKSGSLSSYFWLLLFSFVYGLLHALGPGHGKSLVSSYFLSGHRSTNSALYISLLIGLVHTFSAFFLTVFVYYMMSFIFNSFLNDVEFYAGKVSAIIIILIALYLINKKYRFHHKAIGAEDSAGKDDHHHHSSCACGACQSKSEDLGVILSAGIVPCPGTVTIFIFTFGLGIYFIGFLSAIFMSLGMSLVIFLSAYLSQSIRRKSVPNTKVLKALENGSLLFILSLGLFLLFS